MRGFRRRGQSTVEFTASMVFVLILMVGMIKVFTWTGRDHIKRRFAHEKVLLEDIATTCGERSACVLRQIRPQFYDTTDIRAVVTTNIYGNN